MNLMSCIPIKAHILHVDNDRCSFRYTQCPQHPSEAVVNYRRGGQCVLTLQDRDRLPRRLEAWAETTRRYVIDRIMIIRPLFAGGLRKRGAPK